MSVKVGRVFRGYGFYGEIREEPAPTLGGGRVLGGYWLEAKIKEEPAPTIGGKFLRLFNSDLV